jgi:hypothetical protein
MYPSGQRLKSKKLMKSRSRRLFHSMIAIIGLAFVSSGSSAFAQQAQSQVMNTTTSDTEEAPKLASGELDSLVAPIALYSDPLLAQTLAASTYPLEVIQLQQWMDKNKNLQGKALADAVAKQPWDPSVQGLVEFPDVVQRMAGNVQWTTDLGNAFLAQQSDVMDAVQRMRAKAQGTGNLKTSAQQVVETETIPSGQQVIKIEQANPDVVYVPSYDPTVVYGPAEAEYPYYPYTYPGYVPGTALAWGAGIALGAAAWGAWGGHWGDCNWGGGDVNINNNNNFNKNNNFNRQQGGKFQHNPQHRGNAPYGNRQTANKFGGRGPGGAGGAGRPGGAGGPGGVGKPGGAGGVGGAGRPGGAGGAGKPGGAGGAGAGARPGGGGAGAKPGGGGAGARPSGGAGAKPGGGGAGARPGGGSAKNQVGNRTASSRPSSGPKGGGLSGGSGNYARASSSRGGQSMGGGGMSRGGGGGGRGGGGMSRGGGGGGRGGGGGGRGGGGGGRGGGGGGRRR